MANNQDSLQLSETVDETDKKVAEDKKVEKVEEPKRYLVSYQGEWYDITDFSHPGEGAGVYLSEFDGKEIDEEVVSAHSTDEPQCMLAEAKKKGNFYGIKFVGKK